MPPAVVRHRVRYVRSWEMQPARCLLRFSRSRVEKMAEESAEAEARYVGRRGHETVMSMETVAGAKA